MNGKIACLLALLLLQAAFVAAITSGEAKQNWYDAKEASLVAQSEHREAKAVWAANKTPENDAKVVETGKAVLNAALDEAEAWLVWKDAEAEENPEMPAELREAIRADVQTNLGKIADLRKDVDAVDNQLELGLVWLKMVGKYFELLADVARNTGNYWVYAGEKISGTTADYEQTLRREAEKMENNGEIIAELDEAKEEIGKANENIEEADEAYDEVRIPGTPLLKFSEGNSHLRAAQANLLLAQGHLNAAYAKMAAR